MKCFAVFFNNLNGILSPPFFLSTPQNTGGFIALKKIAKINPKRTIGNLTMDTIVPYIGLPETDNKEVKQILNRPYKEVVGRNVIRDGDILFSRIEPSIFNKKYIYAKLKSHDYAFASTEFYIVEPSENINPKFLFHMFFFDSVYNQILGKTTGSTGRRRLDKGLFENIYIPYPPREKQDKIAELLDFAYEHMNQKEAEAQEILNSIDEYVLDELGIEIPILQEQASFSILASLLEHCRIDVHYHQPVYKQLEKAIAKSIYPIIELCETFDSELVKGVLPTEKQGSRKVLQIRNIGIDGLLNFNEIATSDYKFGGELRLNKGDIIIVITGATIGKVGLWDNSDEFYLGGDMVKFKPNGDFDSYYIQAFLLSKAGQMQILRHITGATNKHLAFSDIMQFGIPAPPLELQKRIGQEINRKINRAKELKQQTKAEVEKAKAEVEKLILGK